MINGRYEIRGAAIKSARSDSTRLNRLQPQDDATHDRRGFTQYLLFGLRAQLELWFSPRGRASNQSGLFLFSRTVSADNPHIALLPSASRN